MYLMVDEALIYSHELAGVNSDRMLDFPEALRDQVDVPGL
jgi:hypothetical protein